MATNFLYLLRWHRVFTDSVWIVFHPWKTLLQTHSTMERWYFCDHQTAFLVISTAPDCGYKLPVPTTMAQSVHWLHLDSFPPMENSRPQTHSTHGKVRGISVTTRQLFSHFHCVWLRLQTSCTHYDCTECSLTPSGSWTPMENFLPLTTNAFHTWKGGICVTTRQLISVISTASNRGYKLPVPTAVEQSVDWLHLDSFPISTHGKLPSTDHKPLPFHPFHAYMHDSSEFVVNLFHNRSIVEDSVITVKIIKSEQWIFNDRPIGLNE